MTYTEIKKTLYRQSPLAKFVKIQNEYAYYETLISIVSEDSKPPNEEKIFFKISVSDMGNAEFKENMEAKFLIRWIVNVPSAIICYCEKPSLATGFSGHVRCVRCDGMVRLTNKQN